MPVVTAVATARPTFEVAAGQRLWEAARVELVRLGADVHGPLQPIQTFDEAKHVSAGLHRADTYVLCTATFADATMAVELFGQADRPILLWAFREPGPVGDRLWLNSLCGANLAAHALVGVGREVHLIYGDPGEDGVTESLRAALQGSFTPQPVQPDSATQVGESDRKRARDALNGLRGLNIGLIGDAPAGFTPCAAHPEALEELLGMRLRALGLPEAFIRIGKVPADSAAAQVASGVAAAPNLEGFAADVLAKYGAVAAAVEQWANSEQLAAVAVRCWPEFPTEVGLCPCSSLGRVASDGIPAMCERDVLGAATTLLLNALGARDTYLVDLVSADQPRNELVLWHCGSAPVALVADGAIPKQYVHCNRRIGVAGDFPLRTGEVTLARLDYGRAGWRLLIAAGESVPAPNRFQGNSATVRCRAPVAEFVRDVVERGLPHHTVMAWQDLRAPLRAVAEELNVAVIEW